MSEYAPLCIYLVISTLLSLVILSLSFVFSTQKADPEKVSAYECGFDPFDDARARFDIRFYLVTEVFQLASVLALFSPVAMAKSPRRYKPNPAGLMPMLPRSAPSAPKAPPMAMVRLLPKGATHP